MNGNPYLGDTTTQDDKVKKQYENLPYPEIDEKSLSDEEKYYSGSYDALYDDHPSLRLQKLDHFLYQGNESFR